MYTQDIPLDPEIADKYIQLELRKRQIEYTIRNEVFQAQETLCNINSTDNDLIKAVCIYAYIYIYIFFSINKYTILYRHTY